VRERGVTEERLALYARLEPLLSETEDLIEFSAPALDPFLIQHAEKVVLLLARGFEDEANFIAAFRYALTDAPSQLVRAYAQALINTISQADAPVTRSKPISALTVVLSHVKGTEDEETVTRIVQDAQNGRP
jgi:hypothetical protein